MPKILLIRLDKIILVVIVFFLSIYVYTQKFTRSLSFSLLLHSTLNKERERDCLIIILLKYI